MAPRMTKRELRQDPVLETIQRGLEFGRSYGRWLGLGILGLAVLLGVVFLVLNSRKTAQSRAAVELAQAKFLVGQRDWERARSVLEGMLQSYGNTASALEGYLLLGDMELALGNAEGARRSFEESLRRAETPLMVKAARKGLAASLENLGRFAEASQLYEEAAGDGASLMALDDVLNAARAARQAGDLARAHRLYERAREMAEEVARARLSEIKMNLAEIEASGVASAPSAGIL